MSNEMSAKRQIVAETYKYSPTWADKVKGMSDQQVLALYYSFKKEGKIK